MELNGATNKQRRLFDQNTGNITLGRYSIPSIPYFKTHQLLESLHIHSWLRISSGMFQGVPERNLGEIEPLRMLKRRLISKTSWLILKTKISDLCWAIITKVFFCSNKPNMTNDPKHPDKKIYKLQPTNQPTNQKRESSWWFHKPFEEYAQVKLDRISPGFFGRNKKCLSCHHVGIPVIWRFPISKFSPSWQNNPHHQGTVSPLVSK